jgi:hypothetical protein
MFEATDIREWRGHDVVDAEGRKIGELEAIYVTPAPTSQRSLPSRSGCLPGTGSHSCRWTRRQSVPGTSGSASTGS